jgi:hypothetical protein
MASRRSTAGSKKAGPAIHGVGQSAPKALPNSPRRTFNERIVIKENGERRSITKQQAALPPHHG